MVHGIFKEKVKSQMKERKPVPRRQKEGHEMLENNPRHLIHRMKPQGRRIQMEVVKTKIYDFVYKNVPMNKLEENERLFAISCIEEHKDWYYLHVIGVPEEIEELAKEIEDITYVSVTDVRPHDISSMVLYTMWCELDKTEETEKLIKEILSESQIRRVEVR